MNFGQALDKLKQGHKVAREGWNGKGMFIYLVRGNLIPKNNLRNEAALQIADSPLETVQINAHIDMKAADGSIVVGWLASQTDMLADDWCVVGDVENSNVEYDIEEMSLSMDALQSHADHCLKNGLPLAVLIDMPGFDSPELITNPPENIEKKMDYYRATYDDNCNHKHAPGIRIIAIGE